MIAIVRMAQNNVCAMKKSMLNDLDSHSLKSQICYRKNKATFISSLEITTITRSNQQSIQKGPISIIIE